MTLISDLARARSEEDVKDAYISALGLKDYTKGLIDIRTDKVWFEAKEAATAPLLMFAQLIVYVRGARARGEPIPAFLAVIDREKGAILSTRDALPALDDDSIAWPASGSAADRALAAAVAPYIGERFTTYPVASMADEFRAAIGDAIRDGEIIRTPITRNNLRQVFDKWVAMIGNELDVANPADLATLFFADIMHDGVRSAYASVGAQLGTFDGAPAFTLRGARGFLPVTNLRGYRDFWSIYLRPPAPEDRRWLIERRDSLLPFDEQRFKGAFYTPLHIVDKAYEQLDATLGANWQERYVVWDMCAGVGNLEAKHSNLRNVFMSTLDQVDVDFMRTVDAFAGAEIFQYDYLNDDVTDFGEIDYTLTGKVPAALRQAIADAKAGAEGARPILVLINPPYGEAANSQGNAGKTGIATNRVGQGMGHLGYAARELFVRFLYRIQAELPTAKLAMFSTLKYVNAPNFELFRKRWDAKYLGGFVVHSKAFDSLKGNFPVGLLIWNLACREPTQKIHTIALDRAGNVVGEKTFLDIPNERLMNKWMMRLVPTSNSVPLTNAVTPQSGYAKVTSWYPDAIGYLLCNSNDL